MEIEQIKKNNKKLNAFLEFNEQPDSIPEGGLSGKTLAVKANMNVSGLHASCASKTLSEYVSVYDAHVVERIKKEGGWIVGVANMDEFACGSSGETGAFGATQNPKAPGYVAGGSSAGCAAAVAAGLVDYAVGSDTGGSIRNPASNCGVVGFKPTYGVVSRYGLIDLAMSLDQIGPLANTVDEAARLLEVLAGYDRRDSTSLNLDPDFYRFTDNLEADLSSTRIGVAPQFTELIVDEGIRRMVSESVDKLADAGCQIIEVDLPSLNLSIPTYYLNVYVEFYSATRKFDGRRYGKKIEENCGGEVLRRILLGEYISQKEYSGKYYRRALRARSVIRSELLDALEGVDVLVGPVVPKLPHKIGCEDLTNPRTLYAYDVFTTPVNLAGLPAGSVPASVICGVPCGLQVIGKPLKDQAVLNVMRGFEKLNGS
ncbi:MAG: Asp-tRNA(Asn)/Glu-tRNA(Gln) amidotransferase subunit GatA [Candidatus Altiarchaeales archaeon]|nr:Asp-tRNA(Asn)/Glu-tRNA(Gln) amidotransferase subunit GatA [Candidatus Altiarchaeales archaeon]